VYVQSGSVLELTYIMATVAILLLVTLLPLVGFVFTTTAVTIWLAPMKIKNNRFGWKDTCLKSYQHCDEVVSSATYVNGLGPSNLHSTVVAEEKPCRANAGSEPACSNYAKCYHLERCTEVEQFWMVTMRHGQLLKLLFQDLNGA